MELQEIIKDLGNNWPGYKSSFKNGLSSDNKLLDTINAYLFNNKGKELRPILSLLAAQSCGEPNKISWDCAAVSEMIHTATLLHDDVVDDSDMRRDALTVKAYFTPGASVLTGDFWLARALYKLVGCGSSILNCFTLAVEELAEGELFQMQKSETLDISEEDYYSIIHKKTASLFIAALKSAVYSVNGNENMVKLIHDYGHELGVAFQIRDDIFDYSPDFSTGKPYGGDIKEKKITLPLIGAFKNAGSEKRKQIIDMLLAVTPHKESQMNELTEYVFKFVGDYNGVAYANEKLMEHSVNAVRIIEQLELEVSKAGAIGQAQGKSLNYLKELAVYVGRRKS